MPAKYIDLSNPAVAGDSCTRLPFFSDTGKFKLYVSEMVISIMKIYCTM